MSTTTGTSTGSRRIALITGGNRGLGRASALALAAAGTDLVITYRSHREEADAVLEEVAARGGRGVALRLDTADVATFDAFTADLRTRLADVWGRDTLDALVNNAGVAASTPLGSTSAADLDLLFGVHVKGVYLLTQAVEPLLADGGRVLNLSSGLARFVSPGGWSVYAAMKGAVEVLTRYWASELGPRGITVNTMAPGPIGTDFGGGAMRDDDGLRAAMGAQAALGRIGEPEDVGAAVAALLSSDLGWVTAQRVEVSGGTKI